MTRIPIWKFSFAVACAFAAGVFALPAHAAGSVSCQAAVHHAYMVVDASSVESLKRMDAAHPEHETVAACEKGNWSGEVKACMLTANSVDTIYHDCYARPFRANKLVIGRMFTVDNLSGLKPKAMTLNGDYLELTPGCGFLEQSAPGGFTGMFVLCDGRTQGPLMTPDEINEAFAAASASEQNRHNIVNNLIRKTKIPYFGGNHRVCDRNNNCHIE
jgi:hypothetical protein